MHNPQFPHSFKVIRPAMDSHGEPVIDSEGNPVETVLPLEKVVTSGGLPVRDAEGRLVTERTESMSYGYRQSSLNTLRYGDVIVSDYKISCPMFLTPLNPGDVLELTDYEKTFRGAVVKKETFNFNTLVWFDRIKNEDNGTRG